MNTFEPKNYYQEVKNISQCGKKTQPKSRMDIDNTLALYFTEQFLANIKNQITQKTKPSKSILEALKHSNNQLIQYKVNFRIIQKHIEELKAANSELKTQNNQLLQTINKLKEKQVQLQTNSKEIRCKTGSLKAIMSKFIHIESNEDNYEIVILKEKMNHLEQGKRMKEIRLLEMIDKESKLIAEIDILKYKNQMLSSTVNCLQETVKDMSRRGYSQRDQEEATSQRKDTKESQFVKNYINVDNINQIQNVNLQKEANRSQRNYSSVAVSCTRNVEIGQEYNIQTPAVRQVKSSKHSDFFEIDGLLEQYLPQSNTGQHISQKDDSSMVNYRNLIEQSQIQIIIDR